MKFKSLFTLALAGLAAAFLAGCAATPLATKPVTTHVVHIAGSGKKLGLVQDPVTGQYSMGYQSIFVGVTTVPVSISQDTNGTITYIEPDVVASYEIAGKTGIFGSGGSTYTVAVGKQAVQTMLGGGHPPINTQFYSTNNPTVMPTLTTTAAAAQGTTINPTK